MRVTNIWPTPARTLLVVSLAMVLVVFSGCIAEDAPVAASCKETEADAGDLLLRTTGTEIDGYEWSEATRNLTIFPVQGPEYPHNTRHDPQRPDHEVPIPADGCVLFRGLPPGWYEVDTRGFRNIAEKDPYECGWYDADPKHVEVRTDRVNAFDVHASLACP